MFGEPHRVYCLTSMNRLIVNLRILFGCAVLLGVPQTSPAWAPRPTLTLSTNAATGAVSTKFGVGLRQSQLKTNRASQPPDLRMRLYCFGLEVKDDAFYAVPYVIKNDPQTVIDSCACLLAVLCITQRSFRRSRGRYVLSLTPVRRIIQSAAPEAPTAAISLHKAQLI